MEPSTKRRKLAPKVNSSEPAHALPAGAQRVQESSQTPYFPHHGAPAGVAGERHEFESFARHLQDAAMRIQRESDQACSRPPLSALLLSWESDEAALAEVDKLDQLLRQEYNYPTRRWQIPNVENPGVKLEIQLAGLLEKPSREDASRNKVYVIYYVGRGGIGANGHLYWASSLREDSPRLEWEAVRRLLEGTPADVLLLLDSCGFPAGTSLSGHGAKQAIAAFAPDVGPVSPGISFTSLLVEAFRKLSTGSRFTAKHVWQEMTAHRPGDTQANGARPGHLSQPAFYSLSTGEEDLWLPPRLPPTAGEQAEGAVNVRIEEARILVCTTYVGEASPDMSYFHQWLRDTPPSASNIVVEGMFLGPPTMLLISMPQAIWNVVQHDKVCCFLGYVHSYNMLHMYERLLGPSVARPRPADAPFDASAASTSRPDRSDTAKEMPASLGSRKRSASVGDGVPLPGARPKPHPESVEMQEAAEQLKALSHVRHRSNDANPTSPENRGPLPPIRTNSQDGEHLSTPYGMLMLDQHRRPRELQCDHCSHAPFKDSSTLRKHVAAAHTRPFPCAFAFAGCSSTFGSKNEWKRHMASQHLCLRFYRCSECPPSPDDVKGSDFNRKDLFTQHLRRMHAPYAIKRALAEGDNRDAQHSRDSRQKQAEWEAYVKDMQQSCLVTRRLPPQKASCAMPDCRREFEGSNAWDEWTEHVGRHMEKGDVPTPGADSLIIQYALDEGIIVKKDRGEYRIVSGMGGLPPERRESTLSSFESQEVPEKEVLRRNDS